MTARPEPTNEPKVEQGHCHQEFTEPSFGKFIIVFDLQTSHLHFVGDLKPDHLKFLPLSDSPDRAEIMDKIDAGYSSLGSAGHEHKKIEIPPAIQQGIIAGGATAYFDGNKLWVDMISTDFGPITNRALRVTLHDAGIEFEKGIHVHGGDKFFCSDGLKRINETKAEG